MFTLRIANHDYRINNKYDYTQKLCRNYEIPDCKAEEIRVTYEEIKSENVGEHAFSDSYLESLAIYRKICGRLLDDDIILFHCSALQMDGKAVLISAPSGTGKSTHARLWKEYFGEKVTVINDDKPLISIKNEDVVVHGTPWCGKHGIETNISAPVEAVFILSQAKNNYAEKIGFHEAYPAILNQTYRPVENMQKMRKTLHLVEQIMKSVSLYSLKCNISQEAVQTAYNTMKRRN